MAFVTEAANPGPKTLDDLLYGFTPEDGAALRASVAGWTDDEPTGGKLLEDRYRKCISSGCLDSRLSNAE